MLDHGRGSGRRFIQQSSEFDHATITGFEWTTIFAQHHTKSVVLQWNFRWYITSLANDRPCLLQMLSLTRINIIKHTISAQGFVTVFGTGNIGGGVEEATISFLDDDTHRCAFLILELVQIDNHGAVVFYRQPLLFQISNKPRQHVVIHALTHRVVGGDIDI